jgi:hypothetical protein
MLVLQHTLPLLKFNVVETLEDFVASCCLFSDVIRGHTTALLLPVVTDLCERGEVLRIIDEAGQ